MARHREEQERAEAGLLSRLEDGEDEFEEGMVEDEPEQEIDV